MASSGGILAPIAIRVFRHALKKTSNIIKTRIIEASRTLNHELQPVFVHKSPRQAIHPRARLRQGKSRWYTTHSTINAAIRRFISTGSKQALRYNRAEYPNSSTATAVRQLTSRAPFASTLRPNLTGGAIPRTAGGYSLGGGRAGGARYFSHTPAAPAQVIHNCSVAVRAFWLSGQKAQFDGISARGEKKYRNISCLQEETSRKIRTTMRKSPGSYIDFPTNPTITALTPLALTFPCGNKMELSIPHLNAEGFLDVLSVDFSRSLKDLAMTMNDLKRLASLGDLPVSLESKSVIRVHFPGCDAESVERLCDEVGVQRGVICQDEDFDRSAGSPMALMFPFAPTTEYASSSPGGSLRSEVGQGFEECLSDDFENPWLEGYESMGDTSEGEPRVPGSSSGYEGLEGIYRFIEECDNARRI